MYHTGNHIIDGDNGSHPSSPNYNDKYQYSCYDCGFEFDNSDEDDLCPNCLSQNYHKNV